MDATVPGPSASQQHLHLHRFDGEQRSPLFDSLARFNADFHDLAGHRCGDVIGIGRVGLRMRRNAGGGLAIRQFHRPRLAIELKKYALFASLIDVAYGQQADNQGLAALDFHGDLFLVLQTVEEDRRRQRTDSE